jgi:hypothetical protein
VALRDSCSSIHGRVPGSCPHRRGWSGPSWVPDQQRPLYRSVVCAFALRPLSLDRGCYQRRYPAYPRKPQHGKATHLESLVSARASLLPSRQSASLQRCLCSSPLSRVLAEQSVRSSDVASPQRNFRRWSQRCIQSLALQQSSQVLVVSSARLPITFPRCT